MKRLTTLLLAAGLICSAFSAANAADIKAKGMWDFSFEYTNDSFDKHNSSDRFGAAQRLRTQIDVIASESLKGVVYFEIGDTHWGHAKDGASLGTDGRTVEVRYSYIDWAIPETDVLVRMGLQPFVMPGFVAGSAVLDGDGAGITIGGNFTENVGANLFWLRAENDNTNGYGKWHDDQNNAMDFVGLTLPLTFDGVKITPWGMYGFVGSRSLGGDAKGDIDDMRAGMLPVLPSGSDLTTLEGNRSEGNAWWVGITGEMTTFSPFRLAGDFNYGSVDMGTVRSLSGYDGATSKTIDLKRSGWLASAIAEYKLDFGVPGLLLWYGSGDNSNPYDGSERMPTVDAGWSGSSFGFDGGYGISSDTILGTSPVGTWGVALRMKDISFMENLTHAIQVGYYRGTNNKNMPANAGMTTFHASYPDATGSMVGSTYLTTKDGAWEATFDTDYQIYKARRGTRVHPPEPQRRRLGQRPRQHQPQRLQGLRQHAVRFLRTGFAEPGGETKDAFRAARLKLLRTDCLLASFPPKPLRPSGHPAGRAEPRIGGSHGLPIRRHFPKAFGVRQQRSRRPSFLLSYAENRGSLLREAVPVFFFYNAVCRGLPVFTPSSVPPAGRYTALRSPTGKESTYLG